MNGTLDRAALLAICERAFVPQERWRNRDTSAAQRQLGECHALLKAGCHFDPYEEDGRTIWVNIEFRGFDWFEYSAASNAIDIERFYLPTVARLNQADGGDWY